MIESMPRYARPSYRSLKACTPLLWLIAAAFMLRALLPAGYMADTNALRRGEFAIAFCSADGSIRSSDSRHPGSDREPEPAYTHCPYGSLKPLALLDPPARVPFTQRVLVAARPAPLGLASEHVGVAGPPLGPRAPPSVAALPKA